LPIGKLLLSLLTAGNPLETQVFVMAGRNEVGGACFITTRQDCEILGRYDQIDRHLSTPLGKIKASGQEKNLGSYVGAMMRCAKIYYKRPSVSIKKNAKGETRTDFE